MPTETKRRGILRWRGVVKIGSEIVSTKWFGTGPKEQRKAILWEEEEKTRLKEQSKQNQNQTVTVSLKPLEWANAYLDDVKLRCSKPTYEEKLRAFSSLFQFTGNIDLEAMTPGLALQFLQKECANRSGHAANKDRKNLMTAWEWGRKYLNGFPSLANPFASVDKFSEDPQPRYVPSEDDFWKVYELTDGQDKVMLSCFIYLAARRGELFRLKWSDVDFHNAQVRLTTKKTKDGTMRADWIPMVDELKSSLLQWWKNRPYPSSEFVFTMLENTYPGFNPGDPFILRRHLMKKLCKRAGVEHFGFHAIRHLSAVILYKSGQPVSMIQKILRHQSPTTTERYLASLGFQTEEMRDALKALSNRRPEKGKVIEFPQTEKASQVAS